MPTHVLCFRRMVLPIVLLTAALLAPALAESSSPELTPREVIEYLHSSLIDVMTEGDSLGFSGRYDRLEPVIAQVHDLPYIARLTLGSHWKELSKDQRSSFIDVFSELSIATYAARFASYDGQQFKVIETNDLPRGGAQVRTILTAASGKKVHLDYLLQRRRGVWKVVNILAEGVSDLAVKQSEYADLLEKGGFEGLVIKIQEKIEQQRHARE